MGKKTSGRRKKGLEEERPKFGGEEETLKKILRINP